MDKFTLEYRVSRRHKWRALTVSAGVPFSLEECDAYRHQIADRQAPAFVTWLSVELRMLKNGVPVTK